MILLHKRQRIIAPSVTVTTAPEGAVTQGQGHGIDSFRRPEYVTPGDKKRELLPSGDREGVFGVIGRQGSVNEIKLQISPHINNGVNLGVDNHHGGFYTSNNHLTPMTLIAKSNDVKDLLSTGPPTRVTSPNSGDSSFNCSTCVPHGQDAEGQNGTDNSVGRRLKVMREYHKNKKITRAHVRVMAIISTILVVFTIGWVPYMIALFLYAMCDDNHCDVNAKILSGLLNLCVLQSFSNFFVYFVKDATFKFRVKQICSFGKNLGFINRVGAAKSADHGMFGVAVGKRNRKHGGGGGGTAARKRTRRTERRSDSKGLQLQSVSC